MLDAARLYARYVSTSMRGQMQYRASFVMQTMGHFVITVLEFLGIWALFDRFGSLRQWRLADVALFYGMINVAFSIADATSRGFDMFGQMVRLGDFDRLLLRPRSTALQLAGQELTLRRVGRLAQGLVVLGWAVSALEVPLSAAKVALMAASIAGAACLFYGLIVLQATLAFWTVESLEVMNTLTYGGMETAQYPLSIYRRWFQRFFTFVVPLACVNYYPVLAILDKGEPGGLAGAARWLAPLVGPVFLAVALRVWKVGVRHYRSTGS